MNDNNIYTITIFNENTICDDHDIYIYCNNFSFHNVFCVDDKEIVFRAVIVPKYVDLIYLQIDDNIYYLKNGVGNVRIKVDSDKFIIKVRSSFDDAINFLTLPNNNYLDTDNKYLYHQSLKTIIPEQIDHKWQNYIKFVSFGGTGINLSIRKHITSIIGMFLKSRFSKFLISDFIKKYNINYNKYNTVEYESFNDFFTRRLIVLPNVESNFTPSIRSPSTSRLMVYPSIDQDNFTSWIKGSEFTIEKLINASNNIKSMMICRLAVQDYHHFHMPCTGTLQSINVIGQDYYSVSPSIINTPVNVFTDNYRHVYQFVDETNSVFYIVAIGALVVGSIEHNMTIGNKYKSGDRIGNFSLGGSTIVVLFQRPIYFNNDLTYYSNLNIESYVKVGNEIGSTNVQIDVPFPKHYHIKNYRGMLTDDKSSELIKIIMVFTFLIIFIKVFVLK
jgi:phosphatidylserine decarboxylase